MGVDERDRHLLHQRLESVLGPGEAATLMTLLPPLDWSEVATKQDLRELEARLTGNMSELDARLTGEMRELEARLTGSMRELDARLTGQMHELEARITGTVHETIASTMLSMNRSTILAVVGSVLGSTTLSLAATRLAA